ncbi:MAG: hypothetical protein NWE89_13860 [Candidatus Bathyarchaeota archaeon]|nr:hypothetical protein [Candidatus Bathyarchaeota archaeon]
MITVKMSDEAKKILEKLQAKITLKTGEKISQQQLLDEIIRLSERNEDQLFRQITSPPLGEEEINKLLRTPMDWGVETVEEEIDIALYREETPPEE